MSLPDYREKMSSQIPALQVLMALGYTYLNPAEALRLRRHNCLMGSQSTDKTRA